MGFKSLSFILLAYSCAASFDFDKMANEIERVKDSLAVRMLREKLNPLVPIPEEIHHLNLTALEHLLKITRLDKVLEVGGPFTVFAPTDEAFVKLPDWVKKAVSNKTILADVLQYHVLYGAVKSTDLKNDLLEKSALGQPIRVNIYDEPAGRKVITAQCAPLDLERVDELASNGIIHVLNRVMVPPSGNLVVSLAACPEFTVLINAVTVSGSSLVGTLIEDGPFTVFAPTDEAFDKLPNGTLAKLLKDKKELIKVLTYHVVSSALCSAGISNGPVKTIEGHPVQLSVSKAGVKVNNAKVTYPDGSATNGVIHAIDTVLLPPSFSLP